MNNSVNSTMSAPCRAASARASRALARLPAISPTVGLSCAMAMRMMSVCEGASVWVMSLVLPQLVALENHSCYGPHDRLSARGAASCFFAAARAFSDLIRAGIRLPLKSAVIQPRPDRTATTWSWPARRTRRCHAPGWPLRPPRRHPWPHRAAAGARRWDGSAGQGSFPAIIYQRIDIIGCKPLVHPAGETPAPIAAHRPRARRRATAGRPHRDCG
jgi:hypothetical protein